MGPLPAAPFYLRLFLTCIALATLLSIGIFSRSIWYDEAVTLQSLAQDVLVTPNPGWIDIATLKSTVSGTNSAAQVLDHYIDLDVHPPLYFLVAHLSTLLFGNDLVVVRYVSLALVLGSVALFAQALRRNEEPRIWLITMIYGLSFAVATTAQDARGYAMALLLGVAAWSLLASISRHRDTPVPVLKDMWLGLVCAGLLFTHYFAIFVVVPLLGWRFFSGVLRKDVRCLIAPIVCLVVFAPWVPVLLEHLGARPNQMTGFQGLLEWIKRMMQLVPAQVLSATHFAIPQSLQTLGRGGVLVLLLIGSAIVLRPKQPEGPKRTFGFVAVWVPTVGLLMFLAASIVMDRWFDTLRYLIFFAPFIAYVAAVGAIGFGSFLARFTVPQLAVVPAVLLVLVELANLNWGWEANRNRGGGYFMSFAAQLEEADPESGLAIIDPGTGRGTLLSAIYSLPEGTRTYLLPPDSTAWAAAADEIAAALPKATTVVLSFTIDRGSMDSDKTALYGDLTDELANAGFVRAESPPVPQGQRFYAKWEK